MNRQFCHECGPDNGCLKCQELELDLEYWRKMSDNLAKCCYLLSNEEGITDEEFEFLNKIQDEYEKAVENEG